MSPYLGHWHKLLYQDANADKMGEKNSLNNDFKCWRICLKLFIFVHPLISLLSPVRKKIDLWTFLSLKSLLRRSWRRCENKIDTLLLDGKNLGPPAALWRAASLQNEVTSPRNNLLGHSVPPLMSLSSRCLKIGMGNSSDCGFGARPMFRFLFCY